MSYMVPQLQRTFYLLVCVLKVKIIPGADKFDSVAAITSNLRVLMLSSGGKGRILCHIRANSRGIMVRQIKYSWGKK